jgi:transcriptional regulator of arginine metabolism
MPTEDPTREILRLAVVGVESNETLLVVHTLGGLATFVGDYLDRYKEQGILATLAGENVVFVVPTNIRNIDTLLTTVRTLVYHHEAVRKK